MGNRVSIPENHLRIYKNVLAIQSTETRLQMIETILGSPEIVSSMKAAGIYGHILQFRATGGRTVLPGERRVVANTEESRLVLHNGGVGGGGGGVSVGGGGTQMTQRYGYGDTVGQVDQKGNERALSYFTQCLRVLGLDDEAELSEDVLKKAYKTAGRKAHPDKGGSEAQFEAVTRAYAYLMDILKRIHGGRTKAGVVENPQLMAAQRSVEADKWKHVEPVKLNPKNLDMNAFNTMFEKTKIPSPDDDGYGDWLRTEGGAGNSGPKFSGKFNREVFNSVFEESSRGGGGGGGNTLAVVQPQALTMAPMMGGELGVERHDSYTAPANAAVHYTDLKQAYTTENVFSHQVAGVQVAERTIKQLEAERGRAPDPMSAEEARAVAEAEAMASARENARQARMKQQATMENDYFERMKRLVIRNE